MTEIFELQDIKKVAKSIFEKFSDKRHFFIHGNLGSGKTTLVQAFCEYLGVKQSVKSPSFGLIHEYESPNGLIYHADLYRLKNYEELYDIGIFEILEMDNYCFVEWPEILSASRNADDLEIFMEHYSEIERKLTVKD